MTYVIYTTESFENTISKLSNKDLQKIHKIFLQLKENPYVGDAIRYRFFREKRLKDKRIYYLVYDELSSVLVVAFGRKKEQQNTIEEIIKYLPEFKKYIQKLLGKA